MSLGQKPQITFLAMFSGSFTVLKKIYGNLALFAQIVQILLVSQ